MQVSQQDQFITHAVVGNQESVSMGVSDDAALMHILSATLYTHPQLAVVREILCNAWDAHIAAGKTDVPVQVTLSDDRLTIRDFGYGIAHKDIGPIYGVYGNSTKRDDSRSTGGFGLGSKAPFAYTDNFEVISHHVGQKAVYRVSKSSMEKGGKPSINLIVSLPTDETGISVSFDLKEGDAGRFCKLLLEVIQLGEIPVLFNGELVALELPLSASSSGYLISNYHSTVGGKINVRYGNVVYPIPLHESYAEEYHAVRRNLECLWADANVIFMAAPDSICIAPSREALILTDATVATLKQLLGSFEQKNYHKITEHVGQSIRHLVRQHVRGLSTEQLILALWGKSRLDYSAELIVRRTRRTYSDFRKAAIAWCMENSDRLTSQEEQLKIIEELLRRKEKSHKALKHWARLLKQPEKISRERRHNQLDLLARYVEAPLRQLLHGVAGLDKVKRKVYQNAAHWSGTLFPNSRSALRERTFANQLTDRRALIARNQKEATEYLDKKYEGQYATVQVWLVGSRSTAESAALLLIDRLATLDYDIELHLPEREKKARSSKTEQDACPVEHKATVKRRKRGTYLSLNHSYDPALRRFLIAHARENYTEDTLIERPLAWAQTLPKSHNSRGLEELTSKEALWVHRQWGDRIAVVTSKQAEILTSQGIPNVATHLRRHIDDTLAQSRDFKRYAAFAYHGENHFKETEQLLGAICFHPELMESLGLRFGIGPDTGMLIELVNESYRKFGRYPKCAELLQKIGKHPLYDQLAARLYTSQLTRFIDVDDLVCCLKNSDDNSASLPAAYALVQLLLK